MAITSFSFYLLICCLFVSVATEGEPYKLYLLDQKGGAACLDGTPPGYYLHEGFGDNKKNYLIFFAGGGFCGMPTLSETLQSCYKRSFTGLGSTKNSAKQLDLTGKGMLSTLSKQNPLFYDWTKIGVTYCDGSEYVGYRQNPISYKDRQLYFRGSRNVKELFAQLDKHLGIYDGNSIIITGVSAGGIASFEWSNYLYENTRKATIYSMPDSGFFITDYYSPVVGKKLLRQNAETLLNLVYFKSQMPEPIVLCMEQTGFDIVDCFNSANYAKFLKANLFMVQSPYDAWSMANILGLPCLTNKQPPYSIETCNDTVKKAVEDYRAQSVVLLEEIRDSLKNVGIWGPACIQHGFQAQPSYNNQKFKVEGKTLMEAIQQYLEDPHQSHWHLEKTSWPANKGCNGLTISQHLISEWA